MRRSYAGSTSNIINPYIALSDLMINLAVVFVVLSATISVIANGYEKEYKAAKQEEFEYKKNRDILSSKVMDNITSSAPIWRSRNDAAGVQRWIFMGETFFEGKNSSVITPKGKVVLREFAKILAAKENKRLWRRLRIEGHSPILKKKIGGAEYDDWMLSTMRAVAVAENLAAFGIKQNEMSVSSRGGQDLYDAKDPKTWDRIDIIVEFSQVDTDGNKIKQ